MARIITNKELKKNAIAALMSGTLTAQTGGLCRYRQHIDGKDCVCVLGATLTNEEVQETGETSAESRSIDGVLRDVHEGLKIISFGFEDDMVSPFTCRLFMTKLVPETAAVWAPRKSS